MNNAQSPHVQKAPANNTSQKPLPATTPPPITSHRSRQENAHQTTLPKNERANNQSSPLHQPQENSPANHTTREQDTHHDHARTKQANLDNTKNRTQDNSQPKLLHAHNTKPPTAKNQSPPLPRQPPETPAQSPNAKDTSTTPNAQSPKLPH